MRASFEAETGIVSSLTQGFPCNILLAEPFWIQDAYYDAIRTELFDHLGEEKRVAWDQGPIRVLGGR